MKALEVKHIHATMQMADIFTKSLLQESFYKWRSKLGVFVPPTPSLRGSKDGIDVGPSTKAQTEKKEKTVALFQPKNVTLSSSEKPVSKQSLREHCTTKPAHCVETKNSFACLDSCALVC